MTITGKNIVTFKDVLIGEVWFCSGQSNMDMRVVPPKNPEQGIRDHEKILCSREQPEGAAVPRRLQLAACPD